MRNIFLAHFQFKVKLGSSLSNKVLYDFLLTDQNQCTTTVLKSNILFTHLEPLSV